MRRIITLSGIAVSSSLLLIKSNNSLIYAQETNEPRLVSIQLITRHGARTPLALIPGIEEAEYTQDMIDPLINAKIKLKGIGKSRVDDEYSIYDKRNQKKILKGGASYGQLTKVGEQQMFDLGKRLREKYVLKHGLLSKEYNSNEIYTRSTHFSRTIRTAKCVLAGLYDHSLNDTTEFLIKVHENTQDWLYPNTINCAFLAHLDKNVHDLLFSKNDEFMQHLNELNTHLSIPSDRRIKWTTFRDDIIARLTHNHQVPDHVKRFLDHADRLASMELLSLFQVNTQIACGLFINLMRNNLLKSIENDQSSHANNENYKFIYYSAHDSTIAALLVALNEGNTHPIEYKWPPFGASIILELWSHDNYEAAHKNKYFIRVLYLEKELELTQCSMDSKNDLTKCDLNKFLKLLNKSSVDEQTYEKLCNF